MHIRLAGGEIIYSQEILEQLDQAMAAVMGELTLQEPKSVGTARGHPVYRVEGAAHWLFMAQHRLLTVVTHRKTPLPCTLQVGHSSQAVRIFISANLKQGASERVQFLANPTGADRLDLDYPAIGESFGILFGEVEEVHARVARDMLSFMCGARIEGYSPEQLNFIAGMVTLLFGVEASRSQTGSALASAVFMLDLLGAMKHHGPDGRLMTFRRFFGSQYYWDRDWSYGEDKAALYGGKYPQAVYEHGGGNMSARAQMTDPEHKNYSSFWRDHIDLLPDRHSVAYREVCLCILWLQARCGPKTVTWNNRKLPRTVLETRLRGIFIMNIAPVHLPFEPCDFPGEEEDTSQIVKGVFWMYKLGYFFHANPCCRLIPSQFSKKKGAVSGLSTVELLKFEEKIYSQSLLIRDEQDQVLSTLKKITEKEALERGLEPCPRCCGHARMIALRKRASCERHSAHLPCALCMGELRAFEKKTGSKVRGPLLTTPLPSSMAPADMGRADADVYCRYLLARLHDEDDPRMDEFLVWANFAARVRGVGEDKTSRMAYVMAAMTAISPTLSEVNEARAAKGKSS